MNTGIMDYGRQLFGFGTSQETKYHGLLNQGATCYLNSVLQVLFMTKDFREAVERHNPENPDTEFIDCDLKALFDDLKVRSAYTYSITKKLRIDRVYEQRDAAEYFEKILRLTSPEVSQIFHGQLTHRTICSACDKVTDANGPFWHLPLALVDSYKGHYSVARGIEEFFKASNICGGNQLYCEQCDAKADATVKSVLTHHPEVLMLLLKRFEFDYQYMAYVKRNCVVDVPYILHIPENQTYELYAFVEHSGDLRSGHYTATVKSQDDDRWYKFNDTSVTLLNSQPYQVDSSEKSRTAYLLFYRKKTTHVADSCTPELRDGGFPPAISDNYVQCQGVEKISERGEDEEAAKKTGLRDMVCVGRGPHLICSVDDQDNKDDVRQRIPDNEDKRGLLPTETQPKERGEDQIYDAAGMDDVRQRTPDINHDFKPRAGDSHARHDHLSKQGDMSNEQRRQMVDMTDMEAQQSNRVAKHQDHEGSGDVRRIHEHEGGKQEVRQHYDPQLGSLGKKGDEERVGVDVKNDEEGKTVEHKRGDYEDAQRKGTSRTKPCISKDLENEDKRRSGDTGHTSESD
ncbi:ubiquitin carboxyl-terminal hydrolase 47-like [Toxotes jaculatrix]|uniref:ubiquitin carboxyl-terminal hydrolase 47-like n=1 Tax=Toxotes jaculatrix TaxID=941984 RepID=UPI001B3AA39D|nr:ubiquitin carboxyl-terminal hydrolase 47-like [Toxotes jaculatrix]